MNSFLKLPKVNQAQTFILCFVLVFTFNYFCHYNLWYLSTNWWLFPNVSTFYMPVGLRLGLALILPIRYWPALLLSDMTTYLTIAYLDGRPISELPPYGLVILTGNFISYYLPLFVIKTLTKKYADDGWLTNTKAVIAFFSIGLVNQIGNAYDGLSYIRAENQEILVTKITSLFAGGWVGIMLVAPLILAASYWFKNGFKFSSKLTFLLIIPSLLITLLLSFLTFKYPDSAHLLRACSFVPLLFFCYKFGWFGGVVIGFSLNLYLLHSNFYLTEQLPLNEQLFYLFGFNITSLLIGAAISEQRLAFNQLQEKAIELEKSNQQNLNLAKKVVNIQENERKRLRQELHDEVGQNLVALQMEVKFLESKYPILQAQNATTSIRNSNAKIYQSIYNILHWLRPRVLDDLGLYKSLTGKYFQLPLKNANVTYQADISDQVDKLTDEYAIAIFRIVQESVTNTIKHSSAKKLTIRLMIKESVYLSIYDDGEGFTHKSATDNILSGFGLQGIKDRVAALSGICEFKEDNGIKLDVVLPLIKGIPHC